MDETERWAITPEEVREHYTLPEQRIKIEVRDGGRGTRHDVGGGDE